MFSYARASLHKEDLDGFYVFYDEIQYLKDWEIHLKSMVDTYRKTKFIASGSAAAALMQRVTSMKIYLTNPTLRCALFSPINESDDACGEMVETTIYDQWILGEKTNFYYANWNKGREKGEVDIVWVDAATQKAFSLAEIKWTDRFYEDPSQLKSLRKFLEVNDGIRKIIITTKSKLGSTTVDGNKFLFIPSSLYAYWVSKYLFEKKTSQILLPARNA